MNANHEKAATVRSPLWRTIGFAAVILLLAGVIGGFTAAITLSMTAAIIAGAIVGAIGALWLPRVWRGTPPPSHGPGERPGYEQFGPLGQPNTVGLGNVGGSPTSGAS